MNGTEQNQDFVEYIKNNQEKFYRLAYSYVKNRDAALDIVQESVYKGWRSINRLKQREYMATWFYRIVINESIQYLRKNKRYVYGGEVVEGSASFEQVSSEALDLYEAMNQLEPKLKTVIVLRYFEDLKIDDIAAILGSPSSTIKSRLKAALEKLKKSL